MTSTRPLPGIRFEAVAQPLRDVLPRMDIPVFAGFAASGPLHVPVAVEDVAQFANVFGGNVELPRPPASREPRFAHLAATVRAFFRNGGRRCWIVRVAGAAVANTFAIPGLMRVDAAGQISQAVAAARSEGSWSDAVRVQTNLVSTALTLRTYDLDAFSIDVIVKSTRDVALGDLVRLSWPDAKLALHLYVGTIADVVTSPPSRTVRLTGRALWLRQQQSSPPDAGTTFEVAASPLPFGRTILERLTFDLTVRREHERPLRLPRLGFTPEHPRYAGALPDDVALFEDVEAATPRFRPKNAVTFPANFLDATRAPADGWPELWRESATPRFPLALANDGAVYVPAGMTVLFSSEAAAEPLTAPPLERDGLQTFSADLFVNADWQNVQPRDILGRADALRYQAGQTLEGIHATLGIEEATMLAAPDAVHCGWFPESESAIASPPLAQPAAKSNEPAGKFVDCAAQEKIPAPVLVASTPKGGSFELTWDHAADATEELQEATRVDFSDAATLSLGTSGSLKVYGHTAGDYFYRVRRIIGSRTSDWTTGVGVRVASVIGFVAAEEAGTSPDLQNIHIAMLRMCAARADLVALLSLPRHYESRDAIEHAAALGALDPSTLSYGALWHPWPISRDEDTGLLAAMPPDGPTAGVMAARAIARGAWVAPANEPLRGVVALTPRLRVTDFQSLQDAAVNVIRHEPAGFLCLDSDTLTTDPDLRALNVRRLLILLRRAAVRTGNDYAFEPNSISLRHTVKRGFEAMLDLLFARGAFAGRNAKSAYQVVTDETVNTRNSVDAGRLIAEIKVAPSRPLSFLTIRLIQRGEATLATEVR